MSNKDLNINVDYITRVEGHGNIEVDVRKGILKKCQLQIVESPRFFEGMIRGRPLLEAQHITARICGICSVGHTLASIQAAENALSIIPSPQTEKLRKLLLHMEILDSHILHIYLLVLPDLLSVKSFVPLIKTSNAAVRRALRLKKHCNDICEILVGRHIHPISAIVGGFTKLPSPADIDMIAEILLSMKKDMEDTVELLKGLKFPVFERETEYIALVDDSGEYPLLHGDIGSSDGYRIPKENYKEVCNEFIVSHSSAKHTEHHRDSYAVGALARYNLNGYLLHETAKTAADTLGLKQKVTNPYLNTVVQAVECVHCIEDSLAILKNLKDTGIRYDEEIVVGLNEKGIIPVKAGQGIGAVEVPRGLLFHDYTADSNGVITDANCVIPTNQNVNNIEHDMKLLIPRILYKSEDEIKLLLEMLVRAYDPCISCSAHFLDVRFVR